MLRPLSQQTLLLLHQRHRSLRRRRLAAWLLQMRMVHCVIQAPCAQNLVLVDLLVSRMEVLATRADQTRCVFSMLIPVVLPDASASLGTVVHLLVAHVSERALTQTEEKIRVTEVSALTDQDPIPSATTQTRTSRYGDAHGLRPVTSMKIQSARSILTTDGARRLPIALAPAFVQ
jgi:hypothetical protein